MNVIQVENLYKQYRLGQVSTGTISHDLNRWWHKVRGKEDPYEKITGINNREDSGSNDYVWALQDINFSVKQGEVLGIIGRNGAGKSTLLKILSKVTSPSKGNIKVKGRIASLLEVGTGFHPELSGRENIFLNGAILGMTKSEIRSKFDEIVAFSGVEKYIDTPVKRYSSGMYVRLAFAVAAHLEPEILIVDEVLAVGDAEFQKKCLGKMKDVSGEGRTVLFVSHNMAAVNILCSKAILLERGTVFTHGKTSRVIDQYFKNNKANLKSSFSYKNIHEAPGNDLIKISSFRVNSEMISIKDEILITFCFNYFGNEKLLRPSFDLLNQYEQIIFGTGTIVNFEANEATCTCIIPGGFLNDGIYSINLHFSTYDMQPLLILEDIIQFEIVDFEREYSFVGKVNGVVRPKLEWK